LSLEALIKRLVGYSGRRIVDSDGRLTPDFWRVLWEGYDQTETDINIAASTSVKGKSTPNTVVFNSDAAGVFVAGDKDILMEFIDKDGLVLATRTLNGLLNPGAGTISITNVSNTGLPTSFVLVGDGEANARADITVTLSDGSIVTDAVTWNANDRSLSGTVPVTGGSK